MFVYGINKRVMKKWTSNAKMSKLQDPYWQSLDEVTSISWQRMLEPLQEIKINLRKDTQLIQE